MDRRRETGQWGERLAARWYEGHGYEVLDANWRCRAGELDLVVARPRLLVFCEVKTRRSSRYGSPAMAVTVAKQRRIRSLALAWLAEHERRGSLRFDVAAVRVDPQGLAAVEVIEGAF